MPLPSQCDCLVIGGGPAGSTAAALVAEAGRNVLLLERDRFPRFQIGESLMPETYWLFERLGLLEAMKHSTMPRKVGVQFVAPDGRESAPFLFRTHDPRECSTTWHVRRADFDQMLLENARAKGATCCSGVRVLDVVIEADRATGVVAQTERGEKKTLGASVVVDASGQSSVLSKKLGLRRINRNHRKAAIWGYYRGAKRELTGGGVLTTILHTKTHDAWFWHIPLVDDLTSVGVVSDVDRLLEDRGPIPQVFDEELANCPTIARWLAGAEREPKLRAMREFSYKTDRSAGDGWVLVGDAWGFIDPVYSAGVFLAMKSAELAAASIIEGLALGDTSASQLGKWLPGYATAVGHIAKLIAAFYNPAFRVGRFIKQFPQHRENLTDILIGRIFQPDAGRIFDDLHPWLQGEAGRGGRQ